MEKFIMSLTVPLLIVQINTHSSSSLSANTNSFITPPSLITQTELMFILHVLAAEIAVL